MSHLIVILFHLSVVYFAGRTSNSQLTSSRGVNPAHDDGGGPLSGLALKFLDGQKFRFCEVVGDVLRL